MKAGVKRRRFQTYKFPGSTSAMDDQVSHISNQVSLQPQNKKHVTYDKCHLSIIYSMQIAIASGCESGN